MSIRNPQIENMELVSMIQRHCICNIACLLNGNKNSMELSPYIMWYNGKQLWCIFCILQYLDVQDVKSLQGWSVLMMKGCNRSIAILLLHPCLHLKPIQMFLQVLYIMIWQVQKWMLIHLIKYPSEPMKKHPILTFQWQISP